MASTKYQNTEKIKPRENQNRKIAFHSHSLFVFIVSPLFHIYLKLDEVFWVVMAAVGGVAAALMMSHAHYIHIFGCITLVLYLIYIPNIKRVLCGAETRRKDNPFDYPLKLWLENRKQAFVFDSVWKNSDWYLFKHTLSTQFLMNRNVSDNEEMILSILKSIKFFMCKDWKQELSFWLASVVN